MSAKPWVSKEYLPDILYPASGTLGKIEIEELKNLKLGSSGKNHFILTEQGTNSNLVEDVSLKIPYTTDFEYNFYIKKIESFKFLGKDWDTFNSEPPNDIAISNAKDALKEFHKKSIYPDEISPTSEEGVAFQSFGDNFYYLFEFYNDGDIGYLKQLDEEIISVDIEFSELDSIIDKLKEESLSVGL